LCVGAEVSGLVVSY